MKKVNLIVIILFIGTIIYGQAPEKMSYQAVIRDATNTLVSSTSVGMQISVVQGSMNGSPVYIELHNPTTNTNGLVSIEIGNGTIISGDFSDIDWGNGPYFLKTETDPTGGIAYSITGMSQLLSVPYSLYSERASSASCLQVKTTKVFEGETDLEWRTLDVSDAVGDGHAYVTLRFSTLEESGLNYAIRPFGDDTDYDFGVGSNINSSFLDTEGTDLIRMYTNSEGLLQWKTDRIVTIKIEVEAFIK